MNLPMCFIPGFEINDRVKSKYHADGFIIGIWACPDGPAIDVCWTMKWTDLEGNARFTFISTGYRPEELEVTVPVENVFRPCEECGQKKMVGRYCQPPYGLCMNCADFLGKTE